MPRKALTEYQKATTPQGEDFLATPPLVEDLEHLAERVRKLMPEESERSYAVIRDACAMLAVREFEIRMKREHDVLRGQIEELVRAGKTHA